VELGGFIFEGVLYLFGGEVVGLFLSY
jgi:hypothetical protein